MSKTTRDTIIVIGTGIQDEAVANAAITPGQIVELLSTGKVQKKATGGTTGENAVAIEDYLQGKAIGDDYASGAIVLHRIFQSGEQALLILADGESVSKGDDISFDAAGEVKATDSADVGPMGIAMETLDASASAGVAVADRRLVVRFI